MIGVPMPNPRDSMIDASANDTARFGAQAGRQSVDTLAMNRIDLEHLR